jgi:hypothetical protein
MKKSIYILSSLLIILFTNPIFAQADPGDDPVAAPIDDSIWVLALIGLVVVSLKFRAIHKEIKNDSK